MKFLILLYEAAKIWFERGAGYYAAAFSYYAPLALVPLLFFSVTVVGFFYGEAFTGKVFAEWGSVLGNDLVEVIKFALENISTETSSSKVPVIGGMFFLGFYIVALNVMSDGFQRLWGRETRGLKVWFQKSLRATVFLFVLQIYFIIIIAIDFFIAPTFFGDNSIISALIIFISTVFFLAALYRKLATRGPKWKACLAGSFVASLFLMVIKSLVDIYIANTPVLTLYGAAGLILILFVWVYIMAAIIFYGAAVAGLYAKIKPLNITDK